MHDCLACHAHAQAMAAQGSGGAYEISQRMTAMLGWGATVNFQEDWTWDQAAQTYALDPAMAEQLRRNNPQVRPAGPSLLSSSGSCQEQRAGYCAEAQLVALEASRQVIAPWLSCNPSRIRASQAHCRHVECT